MSCYSIVKIGNAYVVRVDSQNLLKIANRRMAERLVMQASQLLSAPSRLEETKVEPLAARVPQDAA
ncbi:MAG: hypothetical protein HXX15_17800 [Rhodopseudomonas sp.]|uniref:hypothetical protein n=1 Tax=Rhodopseudomonas sp. TaxID=1078 RepID=UPI0018474362|nr:hypothetical protein [Rhodopseudomonas sp.]NVN87936.1 hypothetical protein [Rhodopseudomonas sp.]